MQPSLDQFGGSPIEITLSDGRAVMVHPLSIDDMGQLKAKIRSQWLARLDADLGAGNLTPAAYARLQRDLYTMPITADIYNGEITQEAMVPFLVKLILQKSDKTITEAAIRAMPLIDLKKITEAWVKLLDVLDPEKKASGDPDADFTQGSTRKSGPES